MAPPSATSTPAVGTKTRTGQIPSIKRTYLMAYNIGSALSWASVMRQLVTCVLSNPDSEVVGAREAFGQMGETTKFVQTMAGFEVVHAALGLVRSSFLTTLSQVFSRFLMVWYILEFYPQVGNSPIYATMVFAWAFTEIIRYTFYAAGLVGAKVGWLETLRYNTFYLLYPMGAGSEAWLIFKSAPYAQKRFGDLGLYGTYVICAIWPPGSSRPSLPH
ncbi:hypothetical protein P7C70_g3380, partial [Phenoliferia sp. Uapishka_3]